VSERDNMQQLPSPSEKFDGGGKITMTLPLNGGPSFDEIWRQHIKHNWRTRNEKPKHQPRRNTIRRRLPMED
jgi:hypothetical protein